MCDGGEIILRPAGLCNLTEVVIRSTDTFESLKRKCEICTILGTFQSTLTNFRYLRGVWKRNAEEERLLGVSLTGIMDNAFLSGFNRTEDANLEKALQELKEHCVAVNKHWAELMGIPVSAAITTVKPSGTVSQLVDSASGIHPRYSKYYIRTVRSDKKDPLAQFMQVAGVPCEDDVMKPENTYVFSFPMQAPETAVFRNNMSAIDQLEHYLIFKKYWCEHNPSITVYVREHEWMEVGAWVYKNFDDVGGISFLPHSDHVYKQAPYQEISEEEYNKLVEKYKEINWEDFVEVDDGTINTKELACVAGYCEI